MKFPSSNIALASRERHPRGLVHSFCAQWLRTYLLFPMKSRKHIYNCCKMCLNVPFVTAGTVTWNCLLGEQRQNLASRRIWDARHWSFAAGTRIGHLNNGKMCFFPTKACSGEWESVAGQCDVLQKVIGLTSVTPWRLSNTHLLWWFGIFSVGSMVQVIYFFTTKPNNAWWQLFGCAKRQHALVFQPALSTWCFLHDGAPPHKCNEVTNWLVENEISEIEWPGNSPNLNAIENAWSFMKNGLKAKDTSSLSHLKDAILQLWWEIDYCMVTLKNRPSVCPGTSKLSLLQMQITPSIKCQ